jgi:hypothetical protein
MRAAFIVLIAAMACRRDSLDEDWEKRQTATIADEVETWGDNAKFGFTIELPVGLRYASWYKAYPLDSIHRYTALDRLSPEVTVEVDKLTEPTSVGDFGRALTGGRVPRGTIVAQDISPSGEWYLVVVRDPFAYPSWRVSTQQILEDDRKTVLECHATLTIEDESLRDAKRAMLERICRSLKITARPHRYRSMQVPTAPH